MLSAFSSLLSKSKPLLDDASRTWLEDCFTWAIDNFDGDFFKEHSQLILPSNQFYPGRVASVHEMASSIFEKTRQYAGLSQWPISFVEPDKYQPSALPSLTFNGPLRGELAVPTSNDFSMMAINQIALSYHPGQVNQPQDLITTIAQNLASLLINQQKQLPPGGESYMGQAVDFLACFMGFGVIMANTAYQFKGGCGSCNKSNLNRQSHLSEHEVLYALALFCNAKQIKMKKILVHLKSHLRKDAKQAEQDVKNFESKT